MIEEDCFNEMDKLSTKDKILLMSLELFSRGGYEGVSMRDIANAVNIKGSSIYKHYKSKQDIFDSIVNYMELRYNEAMELIQLPQGEASSVADSYMNITSDKLFEIVYKIFLYYLKDPYTSKFRRILIMEQYRNPVIRDTFKKIYFDNALVFQEELFTVLIERGMFRKVDAKVMALQFYAPIYLLICQYDSFDGGEEEAKEVIRKHVYQFAEMYEIHEEL
ncbi:TetR/AcrR family transcriptional regulator [Anaerosporobacter sp.]